MSVIAEVLLLLDLLLPKLLKPLWSTVAVVGMATFYKLLSILSIELCPLRLDIWAVRTANYRTLIPFDTKPFQCGIEVVQGLVGIALPIGVLDAEDKLTTLGTGKKVVEKSGSYTADMLKPCR